MNTKTKLFFFFSVVLFSLYTIAIDPDNMFLRNLPWGSTLIITLQTFVIACLAVGFVEVVLDGIQEKPVRDVESLVKEAKESGEAGLVLIYRGLVVLTYGIIMAASIIAYGGS